MSKNYCFNCGSEIPEGLKYCPVCGSPVHKPEPKAPVEIHDIPKPVSIPMEDESLPDTDAGTDTDHEQTRVVDLSALDREQRKQAASSVKPAAPEEEPVPPAVPKPDLNKEEKKEPEPLPLDLPDQGEEQPAMAKKNYFFDDDDEEDTEEQEIIPAAKPEPKKEKQSLQETDTDEYEDDDEYDDDYDDYDDEPHHGHVLTFIIILLIAAIVGIFGYLYVERPDVIDNALGKVTSLFGGKSDTDTVVINASPAASASAEATATPTPSATAKTTGTVTVQIDAINIRSAASTNAQAVGSAVSGQSFSYTDTAEADGFTWYQIGENQWIANDASSSYLLVE
jgi:hypothetical protein